MRSDIYRDGDEQRRRRRAPGAVQKLWQPAMLQHRDRFIGHSLTHAATLITSEVAVAPRLARRVAGATSRPMRRSRSLDRGRALSSRSSPAERCQRLQDVDGWYSNIDRSLMKVGLGLRP